MYRIFSIGGVSYSGFPRTRGDVPQPRCHPGTLGLFPPHTRGCTPWRHPELKRWYVSPAHAGMYPIPGRSWLLRAGFPRTRGDVPSGIRRTSRDGSFPPHTRGCTRDGSGAEYHYSVSPAHAGMYLVQALGEQASLGFPRTRGDVPDPPGAAGKRTQFPPHTRGCTRGVSRADARPQVSPAHAGMYRFPASGRV